MPRRLRQKVKSFNTEDTEDTEGTGPVHPFTHFNHHPFTPLAIIAHLNGRLGNWLFQYAAARSLALARGTDVELDVSRFTSWRNPFAGHVARALGFFGLAATCTRNPRDGPEFVETAWGHDPAFHALGTDTRLRGYFQSPLYWEGREAQIKADLAPARLPRDSAFRKILDEIDRTRAVALHVRRGDYVGEERALHYVCTDAYYERALRHVRERVSDAKVFVFSDDPAWCRTRFASGPSAVVVDLALARREAALDLWLMSRCRHHVVSNSTYSWWGAWLGAHADQIVCTPDRWFNDEAMSEAAMRDTVPARWRRIVVDR